MDRLQRSRRSTVRTVCVCGGAVVAASAWALWPPSTPQVDTPSLAFLVEPVEPPKLPPLDVRAFDTPVWTIAAALQPSVPAPPTLPPPPPLKLQLIGILKGGQDYKAVLYDPDSNKLFVVATGGEAQGHKVDRVTADAIAIGDGALIRTLALKTGGGS
jgi:hypothetical protein